MTGINQEPAIRIMKSFSSVTSAGICQAKLNKCHEHQCYEHNSCKKTAVRKQLFIKHNQSSFTYDII